MPDASVLIRHVRTGLAATLVALSLAAPRDARAAGATPSQATPVQREQAQSRFIKGRDLYNAGKHELALVELNASLDIVASPNTRLYIGRALRDQGRTVAAYVELGRSAVEAKELVKDDARYAKTAEAALDERAQLAPKLGFIEVEITHVAEATALKVSGDEVRRGGWSEPIPVLPGDAELVVETPGHEPIRKSVRVAAGERKRVAVDAGADAPELAVVDGQAPEASARSTTSRAALRPAAYAAGGVAVAGLVTFMAAGAMANGTHGDLEKACGAGPCPPGHEGDIAAGRSQQTIANVGLAVFVIGAAASVTLFVLSAPRSSSPSTSASARVTASPAFFGLQGGF